MRSIIFAGHDFSPSTTAEILEPAQAVKPVTLATPGRAGLLITGGTVQPRKIVVRLFLDAGYKAGATSLSALRHGLYAWIAAPLGGELVLPSDPELTYRDAVCTGVANWDSLFEDGSCELEFTCYDPIAYGNENTTVDTSFEVSGTWNTWLVVDCTAVASSLVSVEETYSGRFVTVRRDFSGGEHVHMDFERERVTVNGSDAAIDLDLDSDFFALEPGWVELSFSGCSDHTVTFRERWA